MRASEGGGIWVGDLKCYHSCFHKSLRMWPACIVKKREERSEGAFTEVSCLIGRLMGGFVHVPSAFWCWFFGTSFSVFGVVPVCVGSALPCAPRLMLVPLVRGTER